MLYFNGILEFGDHLLPAEGPVPARNAVHSGRSLYLPLFSDVEINTSWRTIGDTARLTLGRASAALQQLGAFLTPGYPIAIHLGYNGQLRREFTGYVARVRPNVPFSVELEDESYWLKRERIVPKAWKRTTLREVLEHVYSGPLSGKIPAVDLSPFRLDSMTRYEALVKLKQTFGLVFYFRDKTLFAGLAYEELAGGAPVLYDLYRNVVSTALEAAPDAIDKPGIKAISVLPNGKQLKVEIGDKGAGQVTRHYYHLTTEAALRARAEDDMKKLPLGGLKGNLTTFGIPYITHGQTARILDEKFAERRGAAFVDSVKTTVSKSGGFRRELTLGRQVQ